MNRDVDQRPTVALLDGRYLLHERVGEGGMAEVYRAEDVLLGRTVAVKLMRTEPTLLATDSRARGEVTALATLNHPSLVTLLDARVEHGPSRYLVMEFVDGPTLAERLCEGPLAGGDVVHLATELAAGLHAVHDAGLVHRDVKPSNVLLGPGTGIGTAFQVKIADFGLAELCDTDHAADRATAPGLVLGTSAYLAPEQLRGLGSRPASDIYAFGLVLLEALTGERAFAHTTGIGAVLARLTESPMIPDGLGAGWTELLTEMTARDPDLRPTALGVAHRVASLEAPGPARTVSLLHAGAHVAPRRQMGRHVAAPRRLRALTRPRSRWARRAVIVTAVAAACLIVIQASVLAWGRAPDAGLDLETLQEADVTSTGDVAESSASRVELPEPVDVQRAAVPRQVAPIAEPPKATSTANDAERSAADARDAHEAAAEQRESRKAAAAEERDARKQEAAEKRAADKQARDAAKQGKAEQRGAEKRAHPTTGG